LVIGKENIGSEINISGLGCGGAVRDRITPAIDDVLCPSCVLSELRNCRVSPLPAPTAAP
jgi:hypothetical protein